MKLFLTLYVKELKANKNLCLFLLLLIIGMNAYALLRLDETVQGMLTLNNKSFENFPMSISLIWSGFGAFTLILSIPFLLAHAFNSEWRTETHYQMFALPVPQYTVSLAKISAVASMGVVGGGIVIGSLYLFMTRLAEVLTKTTSIPFSDFALLTGMSLLTYIIFISGVVTGMEGVKFSVKRHRGLTAVAFFIASIYLYGRFAHQGTKAFEFLGPIPLQIHESDFVFAPFVYTILVGIIFLIIGLVVYEKRAEI